MVAVRVKTFFPDFVDNTAEKGLQDIFPGRSEAAIRAKRDDIQHHLFESDRT
jgi:hypothetical protein